MKIKYQFVTESVEVEIPEEWANFMVELDRQEYNANHRETRRHCSLDALNLDDALLPAADDVLGEVIAALERDRLHEAIAELEPQQQDLVRRVHFNGEKLAAIAAEEGVSKAALTMRMKRIYTALRKKLS